MGHRNGGHLHLEIGDTHTCPLQANIGRLEAIARGTGVDVPYFWVSVSKFNTAMYFKFLYNCL